MESLDNTTKSATGFFKHVLKFDEDSKSDMLNIIQYSIISIIPIVILNKSMQKYVPEADDQKGSFEILAEVVIQIICIYIIIGLCTSFYCFRIRPPMCRNNKERI